VPSPRITVAVTAGGQYGAKNLLETVESVDRESYGNKRIVVVADPAAAEVAVGLVAGKTETGQALTAGGTLYDVIGGDGSLRESSAFNEAAAATIADTDLFLPLLSGDRLDGTYLQFLADAFMVNPEHVGGVYGDHWNGDVRVFAEPFCRQRLMSAPIVPPLAAVSARAIATVGKLDDQDPTLWGGEWHDLWHRVSERFILLHVPGTQPVAYRRRSVSPEVVAAVLQKTLQRVQNVV
jgi:hypothetical protein